MFNPDSIVEPVLRQLHDYWRAAAGAAPLPSRARIDPTQIPLLLPNIFLIDAAAALGDFRYRLFGTELCRRFGEDRTGLRLNEIEPLTGFDPHWTEAYGRVRDSAEPEYERDRPVAAGEPQRRYARLLLPLSSDGSKVDMILGGMDFYLRFSDEEDEAPGA